MAIFSFDEKSENVTRDGELIFNVDNFVNNTKANKLCDIMNQYALDCKASGYNEYIAEAYENNTYLLDAEYFNLEEMLYTTDQDKILNADDSDKHEDDENYEFYDANFSKGYFQFNEKNFKDIVKNQIIDFLKFHNKTDSCSQEGFLDFLDHLIPEVVEKDVIEKQLTDTNAICDYSQYNNVKELIRNSETSEDFISSLKRRNQNEWVHFEIFSDSKELAQTLNHEIAENEFLNLKVAFTYEEPENTQQSQLICKTYVSVYDDHNAYPIKEFGGVVTGIISFAELKNEKLFSQYLVKFLAQNLRINAEPILKLAEDFKKNDVHFIWKQSETIFQEFCNKFFKKFKVKENSKNKGLKI